MPLSIGTGGAAQTFKNQNPRDCNLHEVTRGAPPPPLKSSANSEPRKKPMLFTRFENIFCKARPF